MSITPGTKLGPYEVLALVGAGGMGEVYKAKDTRLDRTVAIKVLPTHLADNPDLKQRFEREARAVSSLNHPHICTLHDVGEQDGTAFLVMEYIEGETLADRLKKGALPLDQALRHGIEIADALDKAHRQGVVHRDLKPGNIMLTKSGAKLLDFGLAKLRTDVSAETPSLLSALPTEEKPLTREGSILGTIQYMAPEQLEGKDADARTDIFAFGSVLYEMLTGRKSFEGKSQASLIASILEHDPPPLTKLQPMSPPTLDHAIKTCLAKDPDERWQSAGDVMRQFKWIANGRATAEATALPVTSSSSRERLWMGMAALFLLISLGLAAVYFSSSPPVAEPIRFTVNQPAGTSIRPLSPSVSPDGRHIMFTSNWRIHLRPIDSTEVRVLNGPEAVIHPFWSPDSRRIGYGTFGSRTLSLADIDGSPPQTLCELPGPFTGASWSKEGVILAGVANGGLYQVSLSGGDPVAVTGLDESRGEYEHRLPHFLPDGNHFVYTVASTNNAIAGVYVSSLDSKETRRLLHFHSEAKYAPPYCLLYLRNDTLMAQRFDLDNLELSEEPVSIAQGILQTQSLTTTSFSVSLNGVLAYVSGEMPAANLSWINRRGARLGSVGEAKRYRQVALSPDEKQVVAQVMSNEEPSKLWVLDLERGGVATRLNFNSSREGDAVWSPDGRVIAFSSFHRDSTANIYRKALAGQGDAELLLEAPDWLWMEDWSRDGRYMAYLSGIGRQTVWILPLFNDRVPFAAVEGSFEIDEPAISPDGKWLAYNSTETGQWDVHVQSLEAEGNKVRVSSTGGVQPEWRGDGQELYYLALDGSLMAVEMRPNGSTIEAGVPKPLFLTGIDVDPVNDQYAVTADGERFLVLTRAGELPPLTVVVNWTAELER